MSRPRPAQSTLLQEEVTIQYHDGPVTGDLIRLAIGTTVLWTGRAVRSLPPDWRRYVDVAETTLNVRGIASDTVERIKRGAASRGMTIGEYLGRLQEVHDAARARADTSDDGLLAELVSVGMQTVRR